jgi:hypothetical protein
MPDQQHLDNLMNQQALNNVIGATLLAGAGGIGLRGLLGMNYMFGRRRPDLKRSLGPAVLNVPTPVFSNPNDEERAQQMVLKQGEAKQAGGLTEIPWYLPALTAGGVGGLFGGYKFMDWLMDRKRKADLEGEVDDARTQYRRALLEQYSPATVPSAGQVPSLPPLAKAAGLDELADQAEAAGERVLKQAGWGTAVGAYGALATLLAMGGGLAMYGATKNRNTSSLIQGAIRQRERERWARRPPEIYAVPQPVRLTRQGDLEPRGQPVGILPEG